MSINTGREGHTYAPAEPYQVSRDAIREFAAAVKAAHPAHHDLQAAQSLGHRDLVAPPTFAVTVAQRAEAAVVNDPEAGIDFSRVVHGEESFTHHRPIIAGDVLTGVLHIDRIREAGGHGMVSTRVELTDAEQAPVTTVRSTIVVRGQG